MPEEECHRMTPLRALNDACRALCGEQAERHDDACLALRAVYAEWGRLQVYGSTDA